MWDLQKYEDQTAIIDDQGNTGNISRIVGYAATDEEKSDKTCIGGVTVP